MATKLKNNNEHGDQELTAQPRTVPAAKTSKCEKRIFPSRKRRRAEKIAPSCPL
jgi:hypothetical protein